jgi:hypothetical protein
MRYQTLLVCNDINQIKLQLQQGGVFVLIIRRIKLPNLAHYMSV